MAYRIVLSNRRELIVEAPDLATAAQVALEEHPGASIVAMGLAAREPEPEEEEEVTEESQ